MNSKLEQYKKEAQERHKEYLKQYPDCKWEADLYPHIKFSNPLTVQELNDAYELGMLRKSELVDGKYYGGDCRNASVAQWSEADNCFYYMRTKFGCTFVEDIKHPEDDNFFDLFTPFEEVEPNERQKIPSKTSVERSEVKED